MTKHKEVQILDIDDSCPKLPLTNGCGTAVAVVWPGIGAQERSMHIIGLKGLGQTITQKHPVEAVYYIMTGSGTVVNPDSGDEWPLVEGSMIHVGLGTPYRFKSHQQGMKILGGPCPADLSCYAHLRQR